jgi:ligand-binding SRPBCC domain-containing protein
MRKFEHTFRVDAPLAEVAEFHSRSSSMPAITPPPMIVRIHAAPEALKSGDRMEFTLWAGPLPIHWIASIENVTKNGFTDRQAAGPFASWAHRHNYRRIGATTTEVYDHVEADIQKHPFWGPVGWLMWIGLPLLFRYRARRTRQLLTKTG